MEEKRKYPRYKCKIKIKFNYYLGDPDRVDYDITVPQKGKGMICDISSGGILIITNSRVEAGMPALANFKTKKNKHSVQGNIVRTGFIKNNPTEVAHKLSQFTSFGDSYVAIQFKEPIELSVEEI